MVVGYSTISQKFCNNFCNKIYVAIYVKFLSFNIKKITSLEFLQQCYYHAPTQSLCYDMLVNPICNKLLCNNLCKKYVNTFIVTPDFKEMVRRGYGYHHIGHFRAHSLVYQSMLQRIYIDELPKI